MNRDEKISAIDDENEGKKKKINNEEKVKLCLFKQGPMKIFFQILFYANLTWLQKFHK